MDSLATHIRALERPGGHNSRVTFTPGNDSAAVYIKRVFDAIPGLTSVSFDTFYVTATPPYDTKPLMNIVATLEGAARRDKVLLIGAHYDCSASRMPSSVWPSQWSTITSPGADDNATGVAAIMELARVVSDPASGFPRDITLKFVAFASEESGPAHSGGHGGSRHYAGVARARGEDIIGMLSVDMIGFNGKGNYCTDIVSNAGSTWLGTSFRRALDSAGISLQTNSSPYPTATYSDHETFWNEGFHAILLIEHAPPWNSSATYLANPYYHMSSDSLPYVDLELVKRVTQGVLAMAAAMNQPVTAIAGPTPEMPRGATLLPNYPNPFNPATTIRYVIAQPARVRLSIHDALGREVGLLVEAYQAAGEYRYVWDAAGMPTGVYFSQLRSRGTALVRKLLYVK